MIHGTGGHKNAVLMMPSISEFTGNRAKSKGPINNLPVPIKAPAFK